MIPILYGSQTGNCIHLANLLKEHLKNYETEVLPVDSLDILTINDFDLIIFIVSTHGDGQCPFNMSRFWNTVSGNLPAIFSFKYAILCLGDSSYKKYNYCGRMLYKILQGLGATPILKTLSNTQDKNGIYDGFNSFKSSLDALLQPTLKDKNIYLSGDGSISSDKNFKIHPKKYLAKLISKTLVTAPEYSNKVYEFVFDIPEYKNFAPGDCLGILPKNVSTGKLQFSEEQLETIKENVDLNACLHQHFFLELSEFTQNKLYKDKLIEIYNDYDLYHSYILVPRRSVLELLEDFKLDVTFDFIMKINKIYLRYFSVSQISGKFSMLMNVVDYKTILAEKRKGTCSEYLLNLSDDIEVEIISSSLFLDDKNLLFFCTGTGLTLPRSAVHFYKNEKNIKIFFGFRYFEKDCLCKKEFLDCDITYAASRENNEYIMDAYRKKPVENIDDWLVFVSGNARLNKEIFALLKEIHGKEVSFQSETW